MGAKGQNRRNGRQRAQVARRSAAVRGDAPEEQRRLAREGRRLSVAKAVYDAIFTSPTELLCCTDALDAEVWLSGIWASLQTQAPQSAAFDPPALDLIDQASRAGTVQSLVLLRALAAVGPANTAAAAAAAALAAESGAASGEQLPSWVDNLGSVSAVSCHRFRDVFGELAQLVCEFIHHDGGRRHAFVITVEQSWCGVLSGIDLLITGREIDNCRRRLARDARRQSGRFESVSLSEAASLLRTALEVTADPDLPIVPGGPALDRRSGGMLPLLEQRVAMMTPQPVPPLAADRVEQAWPAKRRAALVEAFLVARSAQLGGISAIGLEPTGLEPTGLEPARMIASRLVDVSVSVLGWPPDRLGPLSVTRLIGGVLPAVLVVPESVLVDLGRVVRVWLDWRLEVLEFPWRARYRLSRANRAALRTLPGLCRDLSINPRYPYVADLPRTEAGGDELNRVLDRRFFAVPFPGQRGDCVRQADTGPNGLGSGQTQVDDLDASQPTHRALITVIHQTWLGTDPRTFPARVGVVEQLWADQPPEVWAAARRLSATGSSREQVIEWLGSLWRRHGPADPEELRSGRVPAGPERDRYLAALIS